MFLGILQELFLNVVSMIVKITQCIVDLCQGQMGQNLSHQRLRCFPQTQVTDDNAHRSSCTSEQGP
jgi:hypothetical protein